MASCLCRCSSASSSWRCRCFLATILCSSRVVGRIEIMVLLKGSNLLVTLMCMAIMCLLVTKGSLKSLQCMFMRLLVTKVFLQSLQCVWLLPKCLLSVTKHPYACQQSFLVHTCLDMLLKCNWGNQAQLKQPWSFYSESHVTANWSTCRVHGVQFFISLYIKGYTCTMQSKFMDLCWDIVYLLSVVLLAFTSLRWLSDWRQFLGYRWLWQQL